MKPMFFYVYLLSWCWMVALGEEEGKDFNVNTVEINHDFTSNENSEPETFRQDEFATRFGVDSIKILNLPEYCTPLLRPKISYTIAGQRIIVADVFAVGVDRMKTIYRTEWTELANHGETKEKTVKVNLPDKLIYREDKIMNISPDLHMEYLLFRASIVDYNNPVVLLYYTEQSVKLTPPWRRMEKQKKYSCSWKGIILKHVNKNRIPQCPKIDDVVDILSFPVALTLNEHGYKKFFEKLHLSEDEIKEGHDNDSPRFTLTTWLFLTKGCLNDMCPLMYHIQDGIFRTPLIGLLKSGHLHIQVHYKDGSGYAFLIDAQLPFHKWIHMAITVKGTVITSYIRHGRNLQHQKTYVNSELPAGVLQYNDTDGFWAMGGSLGFPSAQGFIGPARIYRRSALTIETIERVFSPRSKPKLGLSCYFKNCRRLKSKVNLMLRRQNKAKRLCFADQLARNAPRQCNVGTTGLAAEIISISEFWLNETAQMSDVQNNVYNYVFNMIKTDKTNVKDALSFLSYSSCLGHTPSMYLTSVIHATGLGTAVNTRACQTSLLIGALYNHPLSQMSLAYKHLIGVDGFPEDYEVAQTYYRNAADRSNRLLTQHNEVDTHAEAVRLDKKEDLDNYRGPNSNWFSWLKHQATQGVTDAQSVLGEVFYYGARGFRRNLTKAAEFYEMGANRGDAQMLFNLGVVKLRGQGVSVNENEAKDLLMKAANLGFAPAFNALGFYELNVRQNQSGAVHYFKYAAEQGDRDGLYNLGYAYEHALAPGSTPDLKNAMPYYIDAASKGHPGGCIVAGDAFSKGNHIERNTHMAIIYFKFVADQIPEMGMHLRNGLDGFFERSWYESLLYYLLAAEAGMEIAQYNVALLCEWDWAGVSKHTEADCMWRYYNHSAKLQWVPSLIKTGDNYWYGITTKKNITAAAQLYSKAALKDQNPQAIYNLGYMMEMDYPLEGLMWMHFHPSPHNQGNLSLAAMFYRKCRDSSDEGMAPCSLGLLRVAIRMAWQSQLIKNEVLLIPAVIVFFAFSLLLCFCRINIAIEMGDIA